MRRRKCPTVAGEGLKTARTEMSLHMLAYNLRRMIAPFGIGSLRETFAA